MIGLKLYPFIKKILTYVNNKIDYMYFSLSLVIQLENLCQAHILLIINQFWLTMNFTKGNFRIINSYAKYIRGEAAQLLERCSYNH